MTPPMAQQPLLDIWGYRIPTDLLDAEAMRYLAALPKQKPTVRWVWQEMDRLWNEIAQLPECKADIHKLFQAYYAHPVWLLNGFFTAVDPESIEHRKAIAKRAAACAPSRVVDYGGGFGELARALASLMPEAKIEILEPFPSTVGRAAVKELANVEFAAEFGEPCDVMIAQDVLEHVERPTELAIRMAQAVKPGGYLIFANCFWPVIKCHLPQTFYLRRHFRFVMRGLGLEFIGTVEGAGHAEVYRRPLVLDLDTCHRHDRLAKLFGTPLSMLEDAARHLLRRIRGLR